MSTSCKNIGPYHCILVGILIIFNMSLIHTPTYGQACTVQPNLGDKTAEIQLIANFPDTSGMSGRDKNVWDLQLHKNRIYLGYGNTTTNPGPINLYAVDGLNNYTIEQSIKSEAIEKLRVYNDTLYIPNSDPLGGSSNVNKLDYKDEQNQWIDESWSPSLAHVRDIIKFKDSLYILGNSWSTGDKSDMYSGVHYGDSNFNNIQLDMISSELDKAGASSNGRWNWFFGGIVFRDTLILPNAMLTLAYNPTLFIKDPIAFMKTDTTIWSAFMDPNEQLKHNNLYPVDINATTKVVPDADITVRPFEYLEYNNKLLVAYRTYSIFQSTYLNQYNNSAGMICKSSILDEAEFIAFPNANAVGEDMIVIDEVLYVLTNEKISNTQFKTQVYTSTNPSTDQTNWTEVLHYFSSNMARSFEYLNGYFYFGKGCNFGDDINQCGELIRIPTNCFGNCNIGSLCDDYDLCTINEQINNNCNCEGVLKDSDNDGICDDYDCVPILDIPNESLSPYNSVYQASQTISSDAQIQVPINVEFVAGQEIDLLVKFEVVTDQIFHAYISPCN